MLPIQNSSHVIEIYHSYPSTCKRILVYFSGHGSDGFLAMQDGSHTRIEDIVNCFKTGISKSETVPHMVKMFFFDACRGSEENLGYPTSKDDGNNAAWIGKIWKEGGILVAYASTPLHKSYGTPSVSRWTRLTAWFKHWRSQRRTMMCTKFQHMQAN